MDALHVIADDLTGACDVAAALLPWPAGIVVYPNGDAPAHRGTAAEPLSVHNTQSRILPPQEAARRVRQALAVVERGFDGILLKKIDTGLRGALGAEIDAAREAIGARHAFVLPAIPEVGRTTVRGEQLVAGVPVHRTAFADDPHTPVRDARVASMIETTGGRAATCVHLDAVRRPHGLEAALDDAPTATVVVDAETDADLAGCVRALLARPRPLLLVGSIGLARALRGALPVECPPAAHHPPSATGSGVLVVLGSAHPVARAQRDHAQRDGVLHTMIDVQRDAEAAGRAAAQALAEGRTVALTAPDVVVAGNEAAVVAALRVAVASALDRARPAGLVLMGGETAFHVLDGLGHPPLLIESRPAPLVVRGRLAAGPHRGLPVVTKGGSSGAPEILAALVRQLVAGAG